MIEFILEILFVIFVFCYCGKELSDNEEYQEKLFKAKNDLLNKVK